MINQQLNSSVFPKAPCQARSARARFVTVASTVVAVGLCLVLRRLHLASHPQFFAEDGAIFWIQDHDFGARAILIPYAGYLHFLPRLLAWVVGHFDPIWAPLLYLGMSLSAHLLLVAVLFSRRIVLPWKPVLALSTVLVVHTTEVFANPSNLQWPLALGLVLLSLAADAQTNFQRVFDWTAAAVLALTGPFCLFLSGLFVLRVWRRRTIESLVPAGIVLTGAAVQGFVLVSTRVPINGESPSPLLLGTVLSYRVWFEFGAGFLVGRIESNWFMLLIGAAASALFLARCFTAQDNCSARRVIGVAWLTLVLAVGIKFYREPAALATVENGDRYFYIPHVLMLWWLVIEAYAAARLWRWLCLSTIGVSIFMGYGHFLDEALPITPWGNALDAARRGQPFVMKTLPEGLVIQSIGRTRPTAKPK